MSIADQTASIRVLRVTSSPRPSSPRSSGSTAKLDSEGDDRVLTWHKIYMIRVEISESFAITLSGIKRSLECRGMIGRKNSSSGYWVSNLTTKASFESLGWPSIVTILTSEDENLAQSSGASLETEKSLAAVPSDDSTLTNTLTHCVG